jgi:hypothetical protein
MSVIGVTCLNICRDDIRPEAGRESRVITVTAGTALALGAWMEMLTTVYIRQ